MQTTKASKATFRDVEAGRATEIYDKAAQIFYEKGFDATSMDDLAKAMQITKAGLYYYIESKEDLLFAIMNSGNTIFIVSRTLSLRSWIFATSLPDASLSTKVSRTRTALPSTLKTR